MNQMSVDQVLNQMRALSQTNGLSESPNSAATTGPQKTEFSSMLAESLKQVNNIQQQASSLKTSYETGDPSVDLPEVMVAVQKASVSFEAITQVRNKLISAYQEVMNMQI